MPVPTEPGWYWWKPPTTVCGNKAVEHDWKPMWVTGSGADPLVAVGTVHSLTGVLQASKIAGEWGPRIPSPERLRAIEMLLQTPRCADYVRRHAEMTAAQWETQREITRAQQEDSDVAIQ